MLARQGHAALEAENPPALPVAAVVFSAVIELFEDAASGDMTLTGLPVAIREGLEDERLMTSPQTSLVGLDSEQEQWW